MAHSREIIKRENPKVMKIECPSCQLSGNINEVELPPLGRQMTCPRCKNGFHVAKPSMDGKAMMNSCPSCQYSTFTDEMFAVCPKCGMSAEESLVMARKLREREQVQRDQDSLNRSFRNPDLVKSLPEESAPETVRAAQPIQVTAWLCFTVGGALLIYGIYGLVNYYRNDWQAILSEPVLEPVSTLFVFYSLGMMPWLITLASLYFIWGAYQFLNLKADSLRRLTEAAWAGIAVAVIYEAVSFSNWVRISSSTPSLSYYAVGIVSALFLSALLAAPFLVLLWYLEGDVIYREFRRGKVQSVKE
jgi:predicted Zn finger-like uncharacterized protein